MERRSILRAIAGTSATTTLAGCSGLLDGNAESGPTFENPVFEPTLADPSVIRHSGEDGEAFYAYGTEDNWYGESDRHGAESIQHVPIVRSTNLVDWEHVGQAFESKPDWKDSGGIWAPDIAEYDGEYRIYYAYSEWGDDNPGIGVATADHPSGPFEDQGKLFDSNEIGVPNSIDPFFRVEGGTPYLLWGSWHGIWMVELTADGFGVAGEPTRIAANDHFEAPYVIQRDGRYYFFGSNGHCCNGASSDYHVVVARADSFEGPYRNRNGDPITEARGTTILEGNDAFVGPGHNAVVQDDAGDDWMVYHAYVEGDFWISGQTPRRTLMVDPIEWEDGWPTIDNGSPSKQAPMPEFER